MYATDIIYVVDSKHPVALEAPSMDHTKRIYSILGYLEEHCCEAINLEHAAKLANLSPFHFHRVFKEIIGETAAEYVRRMRYEKAAQALLFQDKSITEIALEFGFSSSQSMARGFKKYLGIAPSQIKQCNTLEQYSILMQNSKIGSKLHKNRYELPNGLSYAEFKANQSGSIEMKTVQYNRKTIAYVRVTGPYGENYAPAVNKLYLWAGARNLSGECIFIYRDNPEVTPADKCRTDIAIEVPEGTEGGNGIEIGDIPAGSYAVLRKIVKQKEQYGQFWNQLIEEIVSANLEMDDRPCFEQYHSYDDESEVADVSFCEAIKA